MYICVVVTRSMAETSNCHFVYACHLEERCRRSAVEDNNRNLPQKCGGWMVDNECGLCQMSTDMPNSLNLLFDR